MALVWLAVATLPSAMLVAPEAVLCRPAAIAVLPDATLAVPIETAEVAEAHTHVRNDIGKIMGEEGPKTRILYGGSVKPSNALELMGAANVNGALVGGASLKAADFIGIIKAYM